MQAQVQALDLGLGIHAQAHDATDQHQRDPGDQAAPEDGHAQRRGLAADLGGDRHPLGQPRSAQRACKAQSFVDKENYTSTDFAMARLRRNQFECKVDSREGDASEARWQFTCERPDGLRAVNRAVNKVSADQLEQVSTETMTREGELWSEVTVRVNGKLTGQACQEGDIPLK